MADKLNYEIVEEKLSSFSASCDSLYNSLKEMDDAVSNSVSVSTGAIYGSLGRKLLRDWDNNCSMFLNFKGLFDDWHSAAVDVVSINDEFEQEAVAATEEVYHSGGQSTCPSCGKSVSSSATICPFCNTPVGGANND